MPSSEAVTEGIRVQVRARYVPERSNPGEGHWFFAYSVRIANESDRAVQLVSRHWIITDADGHVEQVRGPGVVGEQPHLQPGEGFEYTSACPLRTAFGTMHGSYRMTVEGGEPFDVEIAPFALSEPYGIN
jgi:ApaG protein